MPLRSGAGSVEWIRAQGRGLSPSPRSPSPNHPLPLPHPLAPPRSPHKFAFLNPIRHDLPYSKSVWTE